MKNERTAQVIETKRKPPIWSVKAGHRYEATFAGDDARKKATRYAAKRFSGYEVVAKPATTRFVRQPRKK